MKRLLVFLTLAALARRAARCGSGGAARIGLRRTASACSGAGRHDRHCGLFPETEGPARGRAGEPYRRRAFLRTGAGEIRGRGGTTVGSIRRRSGGFAGQGRVSAGSFAGGFRRRDDPSGRSAARPRIQCDGELFARTRIPGNGRCGRACRKLGGRADGNPDSVALRRQYQTPLGRGDAVVRRAGGRYAGRRTAVLHLLYNDAPHDGCLCRIRPYGRRARPAQSQRASDRRAGARHEVQVGRRSLADSRAARAYDGRDRPDGRRRGLEPEMQAGCGLLPQLHPCDTLRASGRARRPICRRSGPSTSIRRSVFSKGRSSVLGAEQTSHSKSTAIPI